ncbi:MAG TPA: CNNM domain-containing protein [Verrucomicrobiae bacterium]|nr:CNNM domain-containing protein [Verrucomicrobiae bacterium]
MIIVWLLLLSVLGILGSAFFSGIETGLISLNRVRLRHEVERKNRRAMILNVFVENTERLLGTTLVGNNLANVLVAVVASAVATRSFGESTWAGLAATAVASSLLLIFGEIVPKMLFRHYAHRLCATCADLLNGAAWLFAPIVGALGLLMRAITRLSGGREQPRSFFVTREELKLLAKEGEAVGALTSEEREMIHGVFDFPYKTVQEVMMPLSRTVTVTQDTAVVELFHISQRTGYARFPVREGDKIVGVANVYEILFEGTTREGQTVRDVMQQPKFVLATDRINHVLPVLRASRSPISIVLNTDNRPLGIITIEDIVEEIVGDVEG